MTDGRFFSVLITILIVVIVALLLLFNWMQRPEGLDRALWSMIITFVGPTLAVLLNNMSNSKQAAKLNEGQQELKQEVRYQGQKMENKAADIAYTASALAREKGQT